VPPGLNLAIGPGGNLVVQKEILYAAGKGIELCQIERILGLGLEEEELDLSGTAYAAAACNHALRFLFIHDGLSVYQDAEAVLLEIARAVSPQLGNADLVPAEDFGKGHVSGKAAEQLSAREGRALGIPVTVQGFL
jgi:hypothetical protein